MTLAHIIPANINPATAENVAELLTAEELQLIRDDINDSSAHVIAFAPVARRAGDEFIDFRAVVRIKATGQVRLEEFTYRLKAEPAHSDYFCRTTRLSFFANTSSPLECNRFARDGKPATLSNMMTAPAWAADIFEAYGMRVAAKNDDTIVLEALNTIK